MFHLDWILSTYAQGLCGFAGFFYELEQKIQRKKHKESVSVVILIITMLYHTLCIQYRRSRHVGASNGLHRACGNAHSQPLSVVSTAHTYEI
jgi:hypothetical protein